MTERTHKDVVKSDISAWGQTAFLKNFSLMFVLGSFFNLSTSILLYFKVWFNSSADTVWTCWTSMSHTWITCMIHGQIQKHQHTHNTTQSLLECNGCYRIFFLYFFLQFKQKKKIWHLQAVESWNETFGNTLLSAYKLNRRLNIETANWCYNKNFFFNSAQHVKSIF